MANVEIPQAQIAGGARPCCTRSVVTRAGSPAVLVALAGCCLSTISGTKGAHANFSLSCEFDGGYTYADQSCSADIVINDGASYSADQCPACVPDILRNPPDASVGDPCETADTCPTTCCGCPVNCGHYTAAGCVLGRCASAPVACELAFETSIEFPPVYYPSCENDLTPIATAVAGSLAFTQPQASGKLSNDGDHQQLVVAIGEAPDPGCSMPSVGPSLWIDLEPIGGRVLQGALYEVQDPSAATLIAADGTTARATTGYLFLGTLDGGANGSFDLSFSDGSAISGAFDAMECP